MASRVALWLAVHYRMVWRYTTAWSGGTLPHGLAVVQPLAKRDFNLSTPYVRSLLIQHNFRCAHCCNVLHQCSDDSDDMRWSLDRIDNDIGHVEGNIVPSCVGCNRARGAGVRKTHTEE